MFVYLKRSRAVLVLGLGLFFLFLINHGQRYQRWRQQGYRLPWAGNLGVYSAPKSRWKELPLRYPPESLRLLPTGPAKKLPRVQHDFTTSVESAERKGVCEKRREEIKKQALQTWNAYHEHAWMHDELAPLSGGSRDPFGGWAATLVDSLDTLWIMGLKSQFEKSVEALVNINFEEPPEKSEINVFETTIRYLGGFLSAYDLSQDIRLLRKAAEIGEMLLVAFDTPNRMPVTRWRPLHALDQVPQQAHETTLLAEIGSLGMEFIRLSQLTHDARWFDAVQRITELFAEQQYDTKLPGMWPILVDAKNANFTSDFTFTLSAMADSFFEYLPKQHALLGGRTEIYEQMYKGSMAVAIEHLLFRPMVPDNAEILIPGNYHVTETKAYLQPEGQHLGCFVGGMFALGGKLFDVPEHVDIGRRVTDGCIWAYQHSKHEIMPEKFTMAACPSREDCEWNESQYHVAVVDRHKDPGNEDPNALEVISKERLPPGFTSVSDRRYILRPEAIESVFILYRITGDTHYQDIAWNMWEAIQKVTYTELGAHAANAAVSDVTVGTDEKPPQVDSMESFWLAETLKYFYLVFCEEDVINLDEWVLNTEAHPFRRPA